MVTRGEGARGEVGLWEMGSSREGGSGAVEVVDSTMASLCELRGRPLPRFAVCCAGLALSATGCLRGRPLPRFGDASLLDALVAVCIGAGAVSLGSFLLSHSMRASVVTSCSGTQL